MEKWINDFVVFIVTLFYIWTLKNPREKRFLVSIDFSFVLRLNLNDGKVTWMSYLSNMQGKGIFEGLFFPPRFPFILRPWLHETGTTQTGMIKFTWARSESMKWLHETGTRLQIGMKVYIKHAGSSYFSFVKCSTANKNTAESSSRSNAFCYCFLKIGPKFFHLSLLAFILS